MIKVIFSSTPDCQVSITLMMLIYFFSIPDKENDMVESINSNKSDRAGASQTLQISGNYEVQRKHCISCWGREQNKFPGNYNDAKCNCI